MTKRFFLTACIILVIILAISVYKNFILMSNLEGKYVLVNYKDAYAFPNYPDTLIIENDKFKSYRYGSGKIKLQTGLIGNSLDFQTDKPSDILPHTWAERKYNGEIIIIMSTEGVYYLKQ